MKLLTGGICVFFLAFATLRAARVPLTYDEAASYVRYIDTTVQSVFDPTALSIFDFEVATNHFLNTLLTKVWTIVAGGSEFALRLPNLIAYAMFIVFSLRILQRYARPWIAVAGLLLLNLNPYVLDFFSLSRGYGLSLGLMMGAVFYLLRLIDELSARRGDFPDASRALAFALAAVMSNFALLNVWLSIFLVVLVAFVVAKSDLNAPPLPDTAPRIPGRSLALLFPIAGVFAALVFSQDPRLSASLYEPVVVRISGLDAVEHDRMAVVRIDLRGRESRLQHDTGSAEWRWPDRVPYRGIRVELPANAADRVERIEVAIGSRLFSFDPRRGSPWKHHDLDSTRGFEVDATSMSLPRSRVRRFQPVMNWAGDERYITRVAIATASALGMIAILALALRVAGGTLSRLEVLGTDQWRPLELAALSVAAFAGPPLYLLKRNAELYFGGTRGLVVDTFYSAIENSFYGKTYHPAQTQILFAGILISLIVSCLAFYRSVRRHSFGAMLPATAILAILIVTSLSLVVQHALFQTVYLAGRTALFYIPLYVLFVTLLGEAIASFGPAGRTAVAAVFAGVVSLATYHFTTTANLKYALDWRDDASTRMMMEDLEQVVEAEEPRRSQVVLGVESRYLPVAVFYAHRAPNVRIEILSLPGPAASDFQYLEDARHGMNVVRRYPLTHTVLVRTRPLP